LVCRLLFIGFSDLDGVDAGCSSLQFMSDVKPDPISCFSVRSDRIAKVKKKTHRDRSHAPRRRDRLSLGMDRRLVWIEAPAIESPAPAPCLEIAPAPRRDFVRSWRSLSRTTRTTPTPRRLGSRSPIVARIDAPAWTSWAGPTFGLDAPRRSASPDRPPAWISRSPAPRPSLSSSDRRNTVLLFRSKLVTISAKREREKKLWN
jgi:hypothetical protein